MLRLYGTSASPFVARVRIQALAKGLQVELAPPPGGLGSAAMRQLSPLGRIPVLEVDGHRIAESSVIQEYIEDAYPAPGLRGRTPMAAARVRLIARAIDLYLVPTLQPLRAALSGPCTDMSEARRGVENALTDIEALLESKPLAAGEELTLADCALAPMMLYVHRFATALFPEIEWQRWPKLQACEAAMQRHPAVDAVLADIVSSIGESRRPA